MIPLFVGYALFVWYLAARYRRSLMAYACGLAGVALLVAIAYLHLTIGRMDPDLMIQNFQILLYPYIGMVGAVSFFIASLPRTHPPGFCGRCGYNLSGLDAPTPACPECGKRTDLPRIEHRPSGVERFDLRAADVRVISAAEGADRAAGEEHDAGHHAQQHPSQG